jgi:hypothetical protein
VNLEQTKPLHVAATLKQEFEFNRSSRTVLPNQLFPSIANGSKVNCGQEVQLTETFRIADLLNFVFWGPEKEHLHTHIYQAVLGSNKKLCEPETDRRFRPAE